MCVLHIKPKDQHESLFILSVFHTCNYGYVSKSRHGPFVSLVQTTFVSHFHMSLTTTISRTFMQLGT